MRSRYRFLAVIGLMSLVFIATLIVLAQVTDTNQDSILSPLDAMYVLNRVDQTKTIDNETADTNQDGRITGADAVNVLTALDGNALPTASFSFSCTDRTCSFDASASTDDVAVNAYQWAFGDGTTTETSNSQIVHTFPPGATYEVVLTVVDSDQATASAMQTVQVDVQNETPLPFVAVSCDGLTCLFDAGGTYDIDGDIVQYEWDLGDRTTETTSTPTVEHTYTVGSTYVITLIVTDDSGATATTETVIDIGATSNFDAPTVDLIYACDGLSCSFNSGGSSDADGIQEYVWDFGDTADVLRTTAEVVVHTYSSYADQTLILQVVDNTGTINQRVERLTFNEPPLANFSSACTDLTCTFDASLSMDNDGFIAEYQWNFDDGSAIATTTTPMITHSFPNAGTFTVELTVVDNEGGAGSAQEALAFAGNEPPVGNYTFACDGFTCSFDASSSSDDGSIAKYEWDFNADGLYDAESTSPTAAHTFPAVGVYRVYLQVTDDQGLATEFYRDLDFTGNQPPTANFTYSCTNAVCNFNGSASSDPDGSIQLYSWDYDSDGVHDFESISPLATHTFPSLGIYTVTLTVRDDSPLTETDSIQVTINASTVGTVSGSSLTE